MFSGQGFFKKIACPERDNCLLPNCFFSHDRPQSKRNNDVAIGKVDERKEVSAVAIQQQSDGEGSRKRRKLKNGTTYPQHHSSKAYVGTLAAKTTPKNTTTRTSIAAQKDQTSQSSSRSECASADQQNGQTMAISKTPRLDTEKRASHELKTLKEKAKKSVKVSLNPRLIPKDPAGHARRLVYLTKMHDEVKRLNNEAKQSKDPETRKLALSDNDLILSVLDEEENLARENPNIYANVVGLRIVAYKRMKLKEWIEIRQSHNRSKSANGSLGRESEAIITGLEPREEVLLLSRFTADKATLEKHGYLTAQPSQEAVDNATKATDSAAGWEVCERCDTRFQVYPDRREDGALTSGSLCTYHWGRPVRPDKKKTDAITGERAKHFSCCQDALGTAGCTTAPTHVFKVTNSTRLASIMPFEETPSNPKIPNDKAVCFDCEMAYTVYGLELVRLSAVRWPQGTPLIDLLIRPIGAVLDLNTRFSGVKPEEFAEAAIYHPGDPMVPPSRNVSIRTNGAQKEAPSPSLQIVSSPQEARNLFFSQIDIKTSLLGHALENDLNTMRIIHPKIVDTAILFPHPLGLPFRFGLQRLAKTHLHRDIQVAGAAGHDSLEDARATGDLVRWKIAREWKKLRSEGYRIDDGLVQLSK